MRYEFDVERIIGDKGVTHDTDARVKVIPYKTKYHEEAQEIKVLVGEVARRCVKKGVGSKVDKDSVLENIRGKVDSDKKEELIAFIEALYFDKKGHLELFHPKVFTYLNTL